MRATPSSPHQVLVGLGEHSFKLFVVGVTAPRQCRLLSSSLHRPDISPLMPSLPRVRHRKAPAWCSAETSGPIRESTHASRRLIEGVWSPPGILELLLATGPFMSRSEVMAFSELGAHALSRRANYLRIRGLRPPNPALQWTAVRPAARVGSSPLNFIR